MNTDQTKTVNSSTGHKGFVKCGADTSSKIHNSWRAMRARCNNKNNNRYKLYGGRGISVCKEWDSYKSFFDWAMQNGWEEGLTLDRIDVNGNYEPSNCRWATNQEQCNNTRFNRKVVIDGVEKNICQWADIYKINRKTVYTRLKSGWSEYDAITKPIDERRMQAAIKNKRVHSVQ